ncbi:hypothetical protein SXIM_25100 [Streptomyces xiamenensis]|uniref:Uncharacterized protein n=1 Tax=Streptomyces xiamenensis TaxID=408015 RepID=A0A0F7FVK5_9ACTN|nr:hypothetical protein SXIM_25100 [Streptomyces xiamenensis]
MRHGTHGVRYAAEYAATELQQHPTCGAGHAGRFPERRCSDGKAQPGPPPLPSAYLPCSGPYHWRA